MAPALRQACDAIQDPTTCKATPTDADVASGGCNCRAGAPARQGALGSYALVLVAAAAFVRRLRRGAAS